MLIDFCSRQPDRFRVAGCDHDPGRRCRWRAVPPRSTTAARLCRNFVMTAILPVLVLAGLNPPASLAAGNTAIRCASTTSTRNSGLFDYLLPVFERESGIEVRVVAVGTGAALELGKRGDVDMVLVHDRRAELGLVTEGWFVNRRDIMYNDFVLAGPPADPVGIRDASSAVAAFEALGEGKAEFVSRGDDSGTHRREKQLWRLAGSRPEPGRDDWYLSVGQGMAKTLRLAGEKQAYTLTDRGTWLALAEKRQPALELLYEGDPVLFNQYGAMAVNPAVHPHVDLRAAMTFIDWLVSPAGQERIGGFRDSGGHALFVPNARSR